MLHPGPLPDGTIDTVEGWLAITAERSRSTTSPVRSPRRRRWTRGSPRSPRTRSRSSWGRGRPDGPDRVGRGDARDARRDVAGRGRRGHGRDPFELGLVARVLHAVSTPSMVYFLLVLGLAALAFELTQPGFGFAGFAGVFLTALAIYGLTVAVPSWPASPCCCSGSASLVLDVRLRALSWPTGAGSPRSAWSVLAAGRRRLDQDQPLADRRRRLAERPVLRLRAHRRVAVARPDRRDAARVVGLVGEARGRLAPDGPVFVKRALARPDERRPDRGRHARPGPGRRRPDPAWSQNRPSPQEPACNESHQRHPQAPSASGRIEESRPLVPANHREMPYDEGLKGWQRLAACRGEDSHVLLRPELLREAGREARPRGGGEADLRRLPGAAAAVSTTP